ncbi:metallophosphoesterase [Aquimarina sp. AD10]|uniref:metallophosphoesterase n=1 Tax=Aquimarina sp. AD10 TaxID=1714849 RepID=UPI000E4D44B7|nr:metallophosphoesterase [Aquimarina sp. AD10]AXT62680.1 metallophosphoesterase [Aquimarina sp. AD10]RKM98325.1 metallophosphoesterase [Aquimarina sp. AD10]
MKRIVSIYIVLCYMLVVFSCKNKETNNLYEHKTKSTTLDSFDGPYIYTKTEDSLEVISVEERKNSEFYVKKKVVKRIQKQKFISKVNNKENDSFTFSLMNKYLVPNAMYEPQEKIFITSDIEGNFNTFYSLLIGNKIMDKDYNWTFGNGHLVIAGDMMDRGTEVLPCLWLLYKLEQEAKLKNGQVHFVLGNHDVMNLQLNLKYVQSKYLELAKIISEPKTNQKIAYKNLMSDANELVKWIKSKNTIEKIGDNLILHGGISEDMIDTGLSIEEINEHVRNNIRENFDKKSKNNEYVNLIFGRMGPLWYRGLVKDYKQHYTKLDSNSLEHILKFYKVNHIIIGHTIIDKEITSDFNGKVIRVAIKHPKEKFSSRSQALLIEKGNYFKVNDLGKKIKLDFTK